MRTLSVFGGVALLLVPAQMPGLMDIPSRDVALPLRILRGTIPPNASLAVMLRSAVSPQALHELVDASHPVYDLARLSVGHPFGLALAPEGVMAAFTYGIDELRTLRVTRRGDSLVPEVLTKSYDVRVETVSAPIRSSLFSAVEASGEQDDLAVALADIFAWDVDFNTEIRSGDLVRAAVEKCYLEGRFSHYGRIVSAELRRGDRSLRAVFFEGLASSGYFAPDGTPLRKAFLRSPLRFSRITSGFTMARLHPITHQVGPHLGIDLAAPQGTPVMAAADGVVVSAGWEGNYGNAIHLRHANGYMTLYGHLSKIRVRPGERVKQGQAIGDVGMTGMATGPHLDYRMVVHGVFVNPMRTVLPPAEPIPAGERASFEAARDRALARLDRLEPPKTATSLPLATPREEDAAAPSR